MKASFGYLTGVDKKEVKFTSGQNILLKYNIKVEKGSLDIKLVDSQENGIYEFEPTGNHTKELEITKTDKYQIVITGKEAKGSYEITWTGK